MERGRTLSSDATGWFGGGWRLGNGLELGKVGLSEGRKESGEKKQKGGCFGMGRDSYAFRRLLFGKRKDYGECNFIVSFFMAI